jgi:hypothetical protein
MTDHDGAGLLNSFDIMRMYGIPCDELECSNMRVWLYSWVAKYDNLTVRQSQIAGQAPNDELSSRKSDVYKLLA